MPEAAIVGSPGFLGRWRAGVRRLKREVYALWLAVRDPRTPWYARLVVGLVAAYALSPIDLVPDFIPIIGYLDDLVLVPLGILLAVRLIPRDVLAQARIDAEGTMRDRPASWIGVALVAGLWLIGLIAAGLVLYNRFG